MTEKSLKRRVLGRSIARELDAREAELVTGAGTSYSKDLLNCETCVTCFGGSVDLSDE